MTVLRLNPLVQCTLTMLYREFLYGGIFRLQRTKLLLHGGRLHRPFTSAQLCVKKVSPQFVCRPQKFPVHAKDQTSLSKCNLTLWMHNCGCLTMSRTVYSFGQLRQLVEAHKSALPSPQPQALSQAGLERKCKTSDALSTLVPAASGLLF